MTFSPLPEMPLLVCGHRRDAAQFVRDLHETVCVQCRPYDYEQCEFCFCWFTQKGLRRCHGRWCCSLCSPEQVADVPSPLTQPAKAEDSDVSPGAIFVATMAYLLLLFVFLKMYFDVVDTLLGVSH